MFKIICFFVLIFAFFACSHRNKDIDYLNGNMVSFSKDSIRTQKMKSYAIGVANCGYGMFSVYDSLLIFWNPNFPDHFFCIYSVDTEKELGFFCNKGRGHNEFFSIGPINQLFQTEDDLKTVICDYNAKKIYNWNISRSILKHNTVFDTIISYKHLKNRMNSTVDNLFNLSENVYLAKMSSLYFEESEQLLPYYQKWKMADNKIGDFSLYKGVVVGNEKEYEQLRGRTYSVDVIKPDGTKVVQAMREVPQINIIDIKTGQTTFYRLSDISEASIFGKGSNNNVYYNSVQADDKYIYATYWGKKQWEVGLGSKSPCIRLIHVFDWDGNLLYELETDRPFFRIALDPIRNRLYTADLNTDEMYYLDLNEF